MVKKVAVAKCVEVRYLNSSIAGRDEVKTN